jgi:chitin-binding protein
MVYTIWQASHLDQSYYFCSDVNFGGVTSPSPSASRSTSPSPSVSPSASRSPSASPSTSTSPPPPGGCTATYTQTGQWSNGTAFQAEVKVTAGATAITGWRVTLAFPSGQQLTQIWNAVAALNGSTAVATNVGYNGSVAAGASTVFGMLGSATGTLANPTVSCTAT